MITLLSDLVLVDPLISAFLVAQHILHLDKSISPRITRLTLGHCAFASFDLLFLIKYFVIAERKGLAEDFELLGTCQRVQLVGILVVASTEHSGLRLLDV